MASAVAILMILSGVAIMAFGLFIFYAWLPILYGLLGFDIGLLLGVWMTGDAGWIAILLGIVGAIALAVASFALEPYRRILLGVSAGFLLGLSLAAVFGLDRALGGVIGLILAAVFGVVGGIVVPRVFDMLIVIGSAVGGAALVMNGAHFLLPGIGLLDRSSGRLMPALLTGALAAVGIIWQMRNIEKWIQTQLPPAGTTGPGDNVQGRPPRP